MNLISPLNFEDAFQAFQCGDLGRSEKILREFVITSPQHFDAIHLLAIVCANRSQHLVAINYYKRASELNPGDPSVLNNWGSSLNAIDQQEEAILVFKKALEMDPLAPEFHYNLANTLCDLKRYEEALSFYEQSIQLDPYYFQALHNYGKALYDLKRYSEAMIYYDRALLINPVFLDCLTNKGVALNDLRRYDEAIVHYDQALRLKPDYAEAWSNKGITLHQLERYDEAIVHYDQALRLKPDYAEAWSNKGVTLNDLRRYDEAIVHYDQALRLKPDYAEAWSNKGNTLQALKRYDEAITHYDHALSLNPFYQEASFNKSFIFLVHGDFENGLPLYEDRWSSENASKIAGKRFFDKPTWLGLESIDGKTILLYGEQGLGDFIQFCRYINLVAKLGAKVILEVPLSLASLMKDMEGISQLVIRGEDLPFFDYQCPLLSLPLAFKTKLNTIPSQNRYINLVNHSSKLMEWKTRLGLKSKPRVGLVWSGNLNHKNDHNRSLLLRDILPFLPDQLEYISLQKDIREVDKLLLDSNFRILSFTDHLNDFLDTATLIDNLDLIISIDTSVAHLSGALGKKTWLLLPWVPDWRWFLDRKDSPWYPSMKLYRQPVNGDWNSVLEMVKLDLSRNFQLLQ